MTNKPTTAAEENNSEEKLTDILASCAAIFGNCLEQYGRKTLRITFEGDKDHDWWFPEEVDPEDLEDDGEEASDEPDKAEEEDPSTDAEDPSPVESTEKPKPIHAKEPESLSALVAQILTILNPKVKAAFGSSALYSILSAAASAYGRTGETVEEKINGMHFPEASQIWIMSKRIFVTHHLEDMRRMASALIYAKSADLQVLNLAPATDQDIKEITEYCEYILSQNKEAESGTSDSSNEQGQSVAPGSATHELSEIPFSPNLFIPKSKPFRNQSLIAARKGVAEINVGRGAIVRASITGADGKPIVDLSPFEINIEATIGQMIQENGGATIIVTPAQVYRKYAHMDTNETVSPENSEKTKAALLKLIRTPATLDFTMQIEKHTKLKKKPGFDYSSTIREGTLITGEYNEHRSISYHSRAIKESFTIYSMPMFYAYSYAVNQIVTIPGNLLTGEQPYSVDGKTSKGKAAPKQNRLSSNDIDLRRYLLERIEYLKGCKENDALKARRKNVRPKVPYEAHIPFAAIAEDLHYDINTQRRERSLRENVYKFMQEQVAQKNIRSADYYLIKKKYVGIKLTL